MKMLKGSPLPLGVTVRNNIVNFSVAVESGKKCSLCIYQKGTDVPEYVVELSEDDAIGEVRFVAFPKSFVKGKEYNYEIDGQTTLDAYVKTIVNGDNDKRGSILLDAYDWEGDKPLMIPNHKVIAYSLHVRGFTKHRTSKVKKKGTFQGVLEKIPYLKELGVNQIQCMPIYAFEDGKRYKNYWGYGEAFCFAVKDEYVAGKNAGKELKDMVKMCHQNGIEVVLNLPFTNQTPKQLIVECLRYYVMEYHVDGFIVNSFVAPIDSLVSDPILKKTKILQNNDHFQNVMRQFLCGHKGMVEDVMSCIKKTAEDTGSYNYMTNHSGFTLADLVSYDKKHNEANGENNNDGPDENYSWNCGTEGSTKKPRVLELRKRQMRNAMFLTIMSQGTPCILAGDEFYNSQNGNNNVYCQDNEMAWLDWSKLEKDRTFFDYVKELISLRNTYGVFGRAYRYSGTDKTGCGVPDISFHGENAWKIPKEDNSRQLGVYYHGEDGTDCFVAYNMHDTEKTFALPALGKKKKWYCVFSTENDSISKNEVMVENQKETNIQARTIVLFVGR